ncbi:cation transporter, partial [uncultured Polaribacter sp.]
MKHIYKIKGMTCGSCKASVENSLRDIDDVSDVE